MFKQLMFSAALVTTPIQCGNLAPEVSGSAVDTVNSLPYSWGSEEPAVQAYRIVAAERGWTKNAIDAWEPMVSDIMRGETGYCWNVRRGARLGNHGQDCLIVRQGRGSDSGFGQVIKKYHYGPGKYLCVKEGLCSADAIVSSPWNSMVSLVSAIEHHGKQPWCYSASARRLHKTCKFAPKLNPLDAAWAVQ
jgi:hypothetical protein